MQDYINSEKEKDDNGPIPVVIVGLDYGKRPSFEHSMEELESLVSACDMEAVCVITQKLEHPDAGTYLGHGKVMEVADMAENLEAEYCIFEDNLSPAQLKNLQSKIGVPVWDRTTLILEIFSRRAKTREARLQVESAYLQYMLPRLSGMWQHLGRQGGGSGSRSNRGIGETQLELDRRQINQRIRELGRELDSIEQSRTVQRSGRVRGGMPSVALVGYTNAGKSTIMNMLLDSRGVDDDKLVLQKDMLFATLDTSIRRIKVDGNRDFLLSDTVGFIENLPHGLVKAFRSTLEEAASANLLLIVLDSSDPYVASHKQVTEDTLKELGAGEIPRLYVMNKADLIVDREFAIPSVLDDTIWMSAHDGTGISKLVELITDKLYGANVVCECLIPYSRGDLLDLLHRKADVIEEEYRDNGIYVRVDCSPEIYGKLKEVVL